MSETWDDFLARTGAVLYRGRTEAEVLAERNDPCLLDVTDAEPTDAASLRADIEREQQVARERIDAFYRTAAGRDLLLDLADRYDRAGDAEALAEVVARLGEAQ